MWRRVVLVIAIGGICTIAVAIATATIDYSQIDAKRVLPMFLGIAGIAITMYVATLVFLSGREREKAELEVEHMTAQLRDRAHALHQSEREAERFATIAAHDLQEPLRTILTFTDLTERRFGSQLPTEARDYVLRVAGAAARMRALIEDLLIYARIGQAERQFEVVDLKTVVDAAIANVDSLLMETEGKVEVGPLPTVAGNPQGLTQLFTNLLANACKYRIAEPPRVVIAAERKGAEYVISVADNGKGIDPAHHDRIFELFRRLEPRDGEEGTGLGLAICARIVDADGGRIWVKSSVGQGATFFFSLPIRVEAVSRSTKEIF